jgi:hypothetical protein
VGELGIGERDDDDDDDVCMVWLAENERPVLVVVAAITSSLAELPCYPLADLDGRGERSGETSLQS